MKVHFSAFLFLSIPSHLLALHISLLGVRLEILEILDGKKMCCEKIYYVPGEPELLQKLLKLLWLTKYSIFSYFKAIFEKFGL